MASTNPRRRTPVTGADPSTLRGLGLKTMGLRKGATFHTPPSSPSSSSVDAFVPPTLSRSQTTLDDVVDAHKRRAALVIGSVDKTLSLAGSSAPATNPTSRSTWRDESIPVPRGFLDPPTVDPAMTKEFSGAERRSSRLRQRRASNNHASDSGLGTSLASTVEKHAAGSASKEQKASAITRSAATPAATKQRLPGLSQRTVSRVHEHILRPLLAKPALRDFRPVVLDIPTHISEKKIVCLRDLEKTLIFMAPERTKNADLYLDFCLTSIHCIQATVDYIPDREQTKPNDRPYSNGYFIDLVEQIRNYADQLRIARDAESDAEAMDVDRHDEIKLFGGINENGRPAELVRIRKDGKAISMATGLPVDMDEDVKGPVQLKRSLSQQAEDEEEILRSMARRKKNASPEELAPKKCTHPGCDKEFKRPCDLTKHEKTHSRPWKCPHKTCKYHEYGWPTEKEMDRHINDKHLDTPAMYECHFKPCPYKSKRESNCKQHMEKAHGWTYVRTKTNGKKGGSVHASSAQPTPQLGNMPTPSSNASIATPPGENISHFVPFSTGHDNTLLDFPAYPSNEEFAENLFSLGHQQPGLMDLSVDLPPLDQSTPSTSSSYGPYSTYQEGAEFTMNDDLYAAHATIPAQLPTNLWQDNKFLAQMQNFQPQHQMPLQTQPLHISPIGEANAMLFTPNSLAEVDEGFDDLDATGCDFQLYSSTGLSKDQHFPLFAEHPSNGLGFSQHGSQDIFPDMDWNIDYTNL